MYCNKKRINTTALLGVVLLLGMCGCDVEAPEQKEYKQESVFGTVTEKTEETTWEAETANAVETEPADAEEAEVADVVKEEEPEEQILRVLTEAEDLYFTSGGVKATELLGYVKEKDASYFIMKKQDGHGSGHEHLYIGVMNPETGELIQCNTYGNTTADAVMIEKESGLYIIYATECTDYGLISGNGGVLRADAGELVPVWPLKTDGTYDEAYWNQHTAKLNGETLETHKVVVTEESPGGTAIRTTTESERTIMLEEILAGAE